MCVQLLCNVACFLHCRPQKRAARLAEHASNWTSVELTVLLMVSRAFQKPSFASFASRDAHDLNHIITSLFSSRFSGRQATRPVGKAFAKPWGGEMLQMSWQEKDGARDGKSSVRSESERPRSEAAPAAPEDHLSECLRAPRIARSGQ